MRKIYIYLLLILLFYSAIIYYYYDSDMLKRIIIVSSNHTVDWITTSLTMGSLLFMLHGFMIPYAKNNVYNQQKYIDYLKGVYKGNWRKEQFRPLKNLSDCLLIAICASLLSSICIAVGFIVKFFVVIAIFLALVSVIGMFLSLYSMKQTLDYMFEKS